MARKERLELRWHKGTGQWYRTKTVDGKTKHFWLGKGTANRQGYGIADELYTAAVEKWRAIGQPAARDYSRLADELEQHLPSLSAATQPLRSAAVAQQPLSISELSQKFLESKRAMVVAGQRSAGRLANLQSSLKAFCQNIGNRAASTIDEQMLNDYHQQQLLLIGKKQISSSSAADNIVTAKTLLRWAYRMYLIDTLPRNVEGRTLEIKKTKRKTAYLSTPEVHRLLDAANERTKLYIYLMLNCGMTQKDIADLTGDEVNWDKGLITRKRSKTQSHEGVPTVTYKLWPEAHTLLKKLGNREGTVLLNTDGQKLVAKNLNTDGTVSSKDNFHSVWHRLMDKVNEGKPKLSYTPTDLRNTGATILNNAKAHRQYVNLYLGHSASNVAEMHYSVDYDDTLDASLQYLYEQLKIAK